MKTEKEDKKRCDWCEKNDLYRHYHDTEWGRPVYDDQTIFEFLVLESFQSGLSWYTILKKRENFREAFDHFDYQKIAQYTTEKVEALVQNTGIVRNRLKIMATINNAKRFMEVQKEFGSFSNYIWGFMDKTPLVNRPETLQNIPDTTPLSDKIAKDLKKRGFKFMGSTVVYAHMQATGMVNDHLKNCWVMREK